jgi:hypothetical protein
MLMPPVCRIWEQNKWRSRSSRLPATTKHNTTARPFRCTDRFLTGWCNKSLSSWPACRTSAFKPSQAKPSQASAQHITSKAVNRLASQHRRLMWLDTLLPVPCFRKFSRQVRMVTINALGKCQRWNSSTSKPIQPSYYKCPNKSDNFSVPWSHLDSYIIPDYINMVRSNKILSKLL